MKKLIILSLLSTIAVHGFSLSKEITVIISGFKSDNGKCIVYLFNNKKDFPTKSEKAIKKTSGNFTNGKCTLVLKDINTDEYAISVLHDENDNGVMETGIFCIPREGVGASNNARITIGPPKYEEAKFQFNGNTYTANIKLNYL
jgi:uncharacterized protein (DUF2141 family)